MNKNAVTGTIVLVAAVVLSGCGLSETRLSDDTTLVASTSPSEAATPSSEAATPAPRTTNSPSSPAETDNTPTPSITKTPKPAATSPAPVRSARASKPAKSVIPCGMMDIKTKEMGKCPPPVTPAKIIPGETYKWFPVEIGKAAEPWGITGELLFANEAVTLIRTAPGEIVFARNEYSFRFATRVTGARDFEITIVTKSPINKLCFGGCTDVRFYLEDSCLREGRRESGFWNVISNYAGSMTSAPQGLYITYIKDVEVVDLCDR